MARVHRTDDRLDAAFRDLRADMGALRDGIHGEFADLRRQLFVAAAIIAALIGVIGALLIAG